MYSMFDCMFECYAGCGNMVPWPGYCAFCRRLAEEFKAKEPTQSPADNYRHMERRHRLFGKLPRLDAGLDLAWERRRRIASWALATGLVLSAASVLLLTSIGGWTVLRWFLAYR